MKKPLCLILNFIVITASLVTAKPTANDPEPQVKGDKAITLIAKDTFKGWTVPSDRWVISDGIITGDTKGKKLDKPEWIYTKQSFRDFIFTADIKVSDGPKANSGIYYRVKPFNFTWRKTKTTYQAPSGYEFDVDMGTKNNGSLGDWYARPSLRIKTDPEQMKQLYKSGDWNRYTILAKGNRLQYWLNGEKVLDYTDNDPKRSPEGIIGIQMHDKLTMKVQFKNASILPLEKSKATSGNQR
ncbi:MAG: 3-keto-disaccharide hydrolase [Akkermansiaceae bacterium]